VSNNPSEDGYVECTECGHRIEGHDPDGCQEVEECGCREGWTRKEVGDVRARYGLPRRPPRY
jgi:hypothetical protein